MPSLSLGTEPPELCMWLSVTSAPLRTVGQVVMGVELGWSLALEMVTFGYSGGGSRGPRLLVSSKMCFHDSGVNFCALT